MRGMIGDRMLALYDQIRAGQREPIELARMLMAHGEAFCRRLFGLEKPPEGGGTFRRSVKAAVGAAAAAEVIGDRYELTLLCELTLMPVETYAFVMTPEWIQKVSHY